MKKFLAAIAFVVVSLMAAAGQGTPKYVFYFIGDGMGIGSVALAQTYNRMVLGSGQPLVMLQFPVASMSWTYSASSPVTDSAAAGTALATGNKTRNGMLGMTPDSTAVVSIATKLHDRGFGIGLVTSVAPDDATPAAFYAHRPARSDFYGVGRDAAVSGFEFIAGANLRGLKDRDGNATDLMQHFEDNGVAVVRGLEALANADSRKVLLLADVAPNDNEIGLVVDSLEGVMTLPAMTQACLDHLLAVSPDGFFMMVEGGAIDHAGHANDAATNLMETLAFDSSLAIAMDFLKNHPDETLIVVTADHETGGLGMASRTVHYDMNPQYLRNVKMSKSAFSDYCKALLKSRMAFTWDDMKAVLSDRLGLFGAIPVTQNEETQLKDMFDRTFELRNTADTQTLYNSFNSFAEEVYNLISRVSGIGWTTGDHSGAPVPVFAAGVGAERFSKMMDNTDLPKTILMVADIEE